MTVIMGADIHLKFNAMVTSEIIKLFAIPILNRIQNAFNEDKFDWDCSGGSDYYEIYYDGERISTVSDLEDALAHQYEGETE